MANNITQENIVDLPTIENPADELNLPSLTDLEVTDQQIATQTKNATEALLQSQQAETKRLATESVDLDTEIQKLLGDVGAGEAEARSEMAETSGVNKARQRTKDITTQLSILARNLDTAEIQATEQARGTLELQSFLDTKKQRVRNQAAVQANRLMAEQSMLDGNIQTAQTFIDNAIAAEFEPQKQIIEMKKTQLESIQDDLTAAEKREWDVQMKTLDKEDKAIERVRDLKMTLAKNGLPMSKMAELDGKTEDEILSVASNYLMSPKEKMEIQKLGLDIKKSVMELSQAQQFIDGTTGDPTLDIITGSQRFGDKRLTDSQLEKIQQATNALGSMETLQGLLIQGRDGVDLTGPLKGRTRTLMTQLGGDADAAAINATIQGLIPTVARGIFGEVGVLTNADIENYKKTVPNLNSTEEQNQLITLVMYDVLSRSVKNTLVTNAQNQANVSGFASTYMDVESRIDTLKSDLQYQEPEPVDPVNEIKMEASFNQSAQQGDITSQLNAFVGL